MFGYEPRALFWALMGLVVYFTTGDLAAGFACIVLMELAQLRPHIERQGHGPK